jgi:hypothetical protein
MQSKTAKLVNKQRVIEILESYGGDANNWPEEERAAASAIIKGSAELQRCQDEARRLDTLMGMAEVNQSFTKRPDPAVVANIVNALPEQAAGDTVDFNVYRDKGYREKQAQPKSAQRPKRWWTYGAAAAAAVVFLSVGLVLQQPSQTLPPSPTQSVRTAAVSQQALDQWMWQEATGITEEADAELAQDEADVTITFMAMVELDLLPDDEY